LKKIIASIVIAIVLGVTVMLVPVITLTYHHPVTLTDSQEESSPENTLRQTAGEGSSFKSASLETLDEAAKAYGRMDTGPLPFPSSLFHVILLVTAGLVAAVGISIYFKRKIKPL